VAVLNVRRALLVANPASRRGEQRIQDAVRALASAGCALELRRTTARGDAERHAAKWRDSVDAVFTLGGDGTVMEVLRALRHTGVPVGIIPAGTGNLLAHALAIPLNVERAVKALVGGTRRTIDLGNIDGEAPHTFAFAAGVGIDVTMLERTTTQAKRRLGVLAYALAATAAALRHELFRVTIVTEKETIQRDASLTMVANFGALLRGGFAMGPGITPDDGYLDVCVYSPRSGVDGVGMVWRMLRGRYSGDSRMYFARARQVVIECDPPRIFQADGEILGRSPVRITVDAGAATLLVPRTKSTSVA
jgi:YegS/Rv2252/BmrU family lipid kinase